MALEWLKGISDKESFEQHLYSHSNTPALVRLKNILLERITALENRSDDFSDLSWAYKQAYENGQRSTLNDLIKLLKFVEDKTIE